MPLSDEQWEEWYERHNANAKWTILFALVGIIILFVSCIALVTDGSFFGAMVLFFLGNVCYGLFLWHRHVDKKLHEEIEDAED